MPDKQLTLCERNLRWRRRLDERLYPNMQVLAHVEGVPITTVKNTMRRLRATEIGDDDPG